MYYIIISVNNKIYNIQELIVSVLVEEGNKTKSFLS